MSLTSWTNALATGGPLPPALLMLLKATIILLVGIGVALALHRSSASTRYLVWLLSLTGLLLLPVIATFAPVGVRILPAAAAPEVQSPTQSTTVPQFGRRGTGSPAPIETRATSPAPTTTPWSPVTIALSLWAVVAGALLLRLLYGMFAVRRIIHGATPLDAPEWQDLLFNIADRLGLDDPPVLLESRDIHMPFAAGIRQPTIVLPAECRSWSAEQRDAVLIHELGHIRRRDLHGHTLGRITCALYWFHPLAWTAARRLRDASERACDDLAIRLGARPSEYAQHLLDIVTAVRHSHTPTAAIAMARRKEFEGRMLAILDPALSRASASRLRTVLLSATLGVSVFAVSAAAPTPRLATGTPGHTPEIQVMDPSRSHEASPRTAVLEPLDGQKAELPREAGRREPAAEADRRHESARLDRFVDQVTSGTANLVNDALVDVLGSAAALDLPDDERMERFISLLATDKSAEVRRVAAWGLQRYARDPAAQAALIRNLGSEPDAEVRFMSAWALGHDPQPAAVQALRTALANDKEAEVREVAAWGLGNSRDDGAVETIAAALQRETSSAVRMTAAWAIGQLQPKVAPAALLPLLNDADSDTRTAAAWALSEIGDAKTLPAVERALAKETDTTVSQALLRAMMRAGGDVSSLSRFLSSTNDAVRLAAARALSGLDAMEPWPWPWPWPIPIP